MPWRGSAVALLAPAHGDRRERPTEICSALASCTSSPLRMDIALHPWLQRRGRRRRTAGNDPARITTVFMLEPYVWLAQRVRPIIGKCGCSDLRPSTRWWHLPSRRSCLAQNRTPSTGRPARRGRRSHRRLSARPHGLDRQRPPPAGAIRLPRLSGPRRVHGHARRDDLALGDAKPGRAERRALPRLALLDQVLRRLPPGHRRRPPARSLAPTARWVDL